MENKLIKNEDLNKKQVKSGRHQEILIIDSWLMDVLYVLGIIFRIGGFLMGILTVTELIISPKLEGRLASLDFVIQVVTLLFVGLLIIESILTPLIRRNTLRKKLKNFWGESEVEATIKTAAKSGFTDNNSKVKMEFVMQHIQNNKIGWIKMDALSLRRPFAVKSKYKASGKWKKFADDNGKIEEIFVPKHIIIDNRTNEIKCYSTLWLRGVDLDERKEFIFTFNLDKNYVQWSGLYPANPMYGHWTWSDAELTEQLVLDKKKKKFKLIK